MGPAVRTAPDDDDDESDQGSGVRSPLFNGRGKNSDESFSARWPWVLLGIVVGVLAMQILPRGAPQTTIPSAAPQSETTCGAVPTAAPPLVRRQLDQKVKNVLVTGGAGFIGSHFALALMDRKGFNVTLVDDLSRGSIETILRLQVRHQRPYCTRSESPTPKQEDEHSVHHPPLFAVLLHRTDTVGRGGPGTTVRAPRRARRAQYVFTAHTQ
jgi:hypothetical protein